MPLYELGGVAPELPDDGTYWIAPNASVMGRVVLRRNASVWFGAVLRGDHEPIEIGEGSNIQDGVRPSLPIQAFPLASAATVLLAIW